MSALTTRRKIVLASVSLALAGVAGTTLATAAETDSPTTEAAATAKPGTALVPKPPSTKGAAQNFTGDVWVDPIAVGKLPSRLRTSSVHFTPGAHTAWHRHSEGQTLHVTEGQGLVQARGGKLIRLRPGDTVYTPPGEWHWHGAAPDHFMTHLAMWETTGKEGVPETEWGEKVTDEEYPDR